MATAQIAVIRWEKPPPMPPLARPDNRGPESRFTPLADELRAAPGEWALVFEGAQRYASTLAAYISLGRVKVFAPGGDFEATARRRNGEAAVWARYVGDEDGA